MARTLTDTATIIWDDSTPGATKASIPSDVALAGNPTTTTQAADNNTTRIATTAHVFAERANTATFTNKRITQRVVSVASSATPTPNADTTDVYELTALAATAAFANPSGTPTHGQTMFIKIKDNGGAQTLSWDAHYVEIDVTLPLTTVTSKWLFIGMMYDANDVAWHVLGVKQEA